MNLQWLFVPVLALTVLSAAAQTRLNRRVQHQLDSIDRAYRQHERLVGAALEQAQHDSLLTPVQNDGILYGYRNQGGVAIEASPDSSDLHLVAAIIRRYGYPGPSLVGKPASEIAWQVLQRTNQTTRFLPQLRAAADKGELRYALYAQAVDYQLMQAGKAQRYGTQIVSCFLIDKTTGAVKMVTFLWPVADLRRANELRRRAGFTTTVVQEARLQGILTEPVTLDYARRMKQAAESGGQ